MLKPLFSSRTRIKLLKKFFLEPEKEFYGRELTRVCGEQINSVRRELDNLSKINLIKKRREGKIIYFKVNKDFLFFNEMLSIIRKSEFPYLKIAKELENLGDLKLLVFSGIFVGKPEKNIDLLIVGDVEKENLEEVLEEESQKMKEAEGDGQIRYSIFSEENFIYRLEFKDKFVQNIVDDEDNVITLNELGEKLKRKT